MNIYMYILCGIFFAGMRLEFKMAELHLCMTGYDPILKTVFVILYCHFSRRTSSAFTHILEFLGTDGKT